MSHERIWEIADEMLKTELPFHMCACKIGIDIAKSDEETNRESGCYYIPSAWNIDRTRLACKIEELLNDKWVMRVQNGFMDTLNTALE